MKKIFVALSLISLLTQCGKKVANNKEEFVKLCREGKISGVTCAYLDLSGINVPGADLTGCDLKGVNLTNSNLAGSNLSGTDLSNANLTNVNFTGANFTGANLSNSIVGQEYLSLDTLGNYERDQPAIFNKSILKGANFTGVDLSGIDFENADTSDIKK